MDVENRGSRDATNVEACIYDPKIQDNAYAIGSLTRATEDLEGGRATASWITDSGDIPQGITTSESVRARLFYGYNTIGRKEMVIVSRDESRARVERGESELPAKGPMTVSDGPFDVEIDTRERSVSTGDEVIDFNIRARNTGGGTPFADHATFDPDRNVWDIVICDWLGWCTPGSSGSYDTRDCAIGSDRLNKVNLRVEADGASLEGDCAGLENGEIVDVRDGMVTRPCRLTVDEVRPEQTIPITVNLGYGYYVSAETSVQVRGE